MNEHSHEAYRRREHIGPYDENKFLAFYDIGPGVYTFNELPPGAVTLDILDNETMTIFKLARGRVCLVTIDEAGTSGSHTLEITLLPNVCTPVTGAAAAHSADSSAVKHVAVCRHKGCAPYELPCTFPQIPVCEQKLDSNGEIKTVMYCVDPPDKPAAAPPVAEKEAKPKGS